jgi:hypothetical protein
MWLPRHRMHLSCLLHLSANPVPPFHGLTHDSVERERGQFLSGFAPCFRRIGPSVAAKVCGFFFFLRKPSCSAPRCSASTRRMPESLQEFTLPEPFRLWPLTPLPRAALR